MSGKMDWDRVRKENLSFMHGSEWLAPSDNVLDSTRLARSKINEQEGFTQKFLSAVAAAETQGKCAGANGENERISRKIRVRASSLRI